MTTDFSTTRGALASSLKDFTQSSSRAIKRLYAGPRREKGIYEDIDYESGEEPVAKLDEVGEGPNETVFLIYL